MPCKGLHCNGCRGGGGIGLAVIVALVLVIAAVGKAARRAAAEAGHVLDVVLEVVVVGLAVLAAAAVVTVLAWVGVRARRWHATRSAVTAVDAVPAVGHAEVAPPEYLAIEAPKPRLADTSWTREEVTDDSR